MARFGDALMDDDTLEIVLHPGKVFELQERELEVRVYLQTAVVDILKTLQHKSKVRRETVQLNVFLRTHLLVTVVAVVGVLILQDLRLEIVVDWILQPLKTLYLNTETREILLFLGLVLAVQTLNHWSLLSVEESLNEVLPRRQKGFNAIEKYVSKLIHVHLDI